MTRRAAFSQVVKFFLNVVNLFLGFFWWYGSPFFRVVFFSLFRRVACSLQKHLHSSGNAGKRFFLWGIGKKLEDSRGAFLRGFPGEVFAVEDLEVGDKFCLHGDGESLLEFPVLPVC